MTVRLRLIFLCQFLLVLFIAPITLTAQDLAPDEADIVLPPMVLELQDLHTDQIIADVPEQTAELEPEIDIPLPEPPELNVPVDLISLVPPEAGAGDQRGPGYSADRSFFSKGTIGIGSMNQMFGDITLYKLGSEPHFSLHFLHNRLDGYGLRPPGTQFYRQIDRVNGDFSWIGERASVEAEAEYADAAEGLQAIGSFSEVRRRFLGGNAAFSFTGFEFFRIDSALDAGWFHETLAGPSPVNSDEFFIHPLAAAGVILGPVYISLTGEYEYRRNYGASSGLHRIRADWRVDADIGETVKLSGAVGIDWDTAPQSLIEIPFSLSAVFTLSNSFILRGSGGYAVDSLRYYRIGEDEPFVRMNGGVPYPKNLKWFGAAGFTWNIRPILTLSGDAELAWRERYFAPSASPDPASGLYVLVPGQSTVLEMKSGLRYQPVDILSLQFSWSGTFLTPPVYRPRQLFDLGVELRSTDSRWGGAFNAGLPVRDTVQLPVIDVSAFFSPANGVEFTLEAADFLSPLLNGGRTQFGQFEAPGFHVLFKTSISL